MRISLNISKEFLGRSLFTLIIAIFLLLPSKGFSQDDQDVDVQSGSSSGSQQPDRNGSVINSSPWQNGAGSGATTDAGSATTGAARPAAAQRPGSTLDGPGGGDPGGNPDVPFDENMNLAFLAAGVVFAFYIAKKRLFSKAVTIKTKK